MSGNHTPTPWYLEVTDSALWIGVEKAAGGKVGDVITSLEYGDDYNPWHNEAAKANAELIVLAVNSYASSQAEIERLRKALKPFARLAEIEHKAPAGSVVKVNVDRCRDALTALSGGKP